MRLHALRFEVSIIRKIEKKYLNKECPLGIIDIIHGDEELSHIYSKLPYEIQEEIQGIDNQTIVPNFLSDVIFKGIFDPDVHKESLSAFVSSILGKKVKVLHSLQQEGIYLSEQSKKVVLDIVVQFDDGSLGNIEIQRRGINFPSTRAAVYSSNMITRQFTAATDERKGDIDYDLVKPVYTIVIFEKSPPPFDGMTEYIHFFQQKSKTGADIELLQYYDFICLDIFRKYKPHVVGKLERWLEFLSIRDTVEMAGFLVENPSFAKLYKRGILMLQSREGVLRMLNQFMFEEDVLSSLERTNKSIVKRLKKELEEKDNIIAEKDSKLAEQGSKLAEQAGKLAEQDGKLAEQAAEIERLKQLVKK